MAGDSINIIYPPPELKSKCMKGKLTFLNISFNRSYISLDIIDKTASFIARNGPEFATRIQQAEPNNDKFNFLKPDDPFNSYYQLKVTEFRERAINGNTIPGPIVGSVKK